ncbi:MAG: hypothetical protein HF973_07405 [Chloroflexi bacterium]|nr:hypothetical protein [Chloroflexota bacterium]
MRYLQLIAGLFVLLFVAAACSSATVEPTAVPTEAADGMDNMGNGEHGADQFAPLVGGLYEGGEVKFIHTETSDPDVTTMLTEMMGGPKVFLVPALTDLPSSALATLYVFTNGLSEGLDGYGPFGFQRDIFDSVPRDEGYSPLRNVLLVAWVEDATPRELLSVAELKEAEANGEVTVTESGIVVNFPVMVWPDGSR